MNATILIAGLVSSLLIFLVLYKACQAWKNYEKRKWEEIEWCKQEGLRLADALGLEYPHKKHLYPKEK